MTDLGKIDRSVFESVIAPRLGADRGDVRLGPRHGVDFGVLEVGGDAVVVATDPVSILPELGWRRAGRLALEIVLADVAVSGIPPTHLAISLSLPPDLDDDSLLALWEGVDACASDHGVSIVSGHTARYPGIDTSWVGGATVFGVGDLADVVRPDGARPGDDLVVSTGPGAEVAGLFATLFPDALDLPAETVRVAGERVEDIAVVADARAAFEAGSVTAMHDATEGGIQGGLVEMAEGAGVRFDVDRAGVPIAEGVEPVCAAAGIDPWRASSAGTLLMAVAAGADAVVDALEARDTPAAVVGTVSEGSGVYVDGERIETPGADPAWDAFRRLSDG